MRKLMYEVTNADGTKFQTADYRKTAGAASVRTYLVPEDTRSKAEKEWAAAHARKIRERRG